MDHPFIEESGFLHRRDTQILAQDLDATLILCQGRVPVSQKPIQLHHLSVDFFAGMIADQDAFAIGKAAFT